MPALQNAALDKIAQEFFSSYGSAEIGEIAVGYASELQAAERSVGRILDGIDVAIFDENGRQLSHGGVGVIHVKGPAGTSGTYIGNDAVGQTAFRNGWFATGDIGSVDGNRNLILRGRANSLINIGGSKVNPEVIEELLMTHDKIVDAGVAGLDVREGYQKIGALIVSTANLSIEEINAFLRQRQFRWPIQAIKQVAALPKTPTGKTDRVALKAVFAGPAS